MLLVHLPLILSIQKLTTKQLTKLIPENPGGFKSLIKIPPAHAVELLYFSDSPSSSSQEAADGSDIDASLCVFDGLAIELHKRLEAPSGTQGCFVHLANRTLQSMINMLGNI
ncbi:hypothetical protein DY000_02014647 [Brassica cretica]|uniref:Uncharacterized protein n=1 Tax=Brassica cretica TaxID=69181 RepID=A0ABQ7DBL2_BRACR|nr:hypothetical protein DY000_02014647 [Brassica cretica]